MNYTTLDIEGCAFKPEHAGKPPLDTYHIPKAHPNEFLIEKSPQYARGNRNAIQQIARNMLDANQKMKLFAFLTGCIRPLNPDNLFLRFQIPLKGFTRLSTIVQ